MAQTPTEEVIYDDTPEAYQIRRQAALDAAATAEG